MRRKGLLPKRRVSSKPTISELDDLHKGSITAKEEKAVVDYDGMTVAALKDILRERGLQVSGLKEELKIRLRDYDTTSTSAKDSEDFDNGVFSSSEKDFLGKLPAPVGVSSSAWVKSSSETAFNDRKFKDQVIQEEQKSIIAQFRRGESVKATVLRYGPLGASVSIAPGSTESSNAIVIVDTNQQQMGLILQDQIEYWAALNKRDPQVGEILNAYIQKIRDDGKMDIALRPVGYDKVTTARDQ